MNCVNAGRPSIAWYCDCQSRTSNSRVCLEKLRLLPKTTSSSIIPREVAASPGTTPYNTMLDFFHTDRGIIILCRVLTKIMFMLLPPSMKILSMSYPFDLGVEDQGSVPRPWDCRRVVALGERDAGFCVL